jgi:alpha-mannosidase
VTAGRLRVTLVPHTHWDREWYEPFAVFSERLETMMDTLLDLAADGFPHFHLDGQTAMIDDYLERRPDRVGELSDHVHEGRLSAGPWVAQMDEFLTSGESHVRNLEMGLERARELGRALEVGYMPDQFGHIGQMPQILRLAGIERAMVWRGVPSAISTSTFRWQAPDGSEVLTESLPLGYSSGWKLMRDEEPFAEVLVREAERLRPYSRDGRVVLMVGYDHAGPDPELPKRLVDTGLSDGLDVAIGGVADHVGGLQWRDDLPLWRGELRSSARAHLLPNVCSARVYQKRERGRVEALIERYAEPLAALVPEFSWPADELRRAWTLLLWNGAHDSACGCSHDEVALDVDERFAEARAIGDAIVREALMSLGEQVGDAGVIRFNPSPFQREGVPALGYTVLPEGPSPYFGTLDVVPLADGSGVSVDGLALRLVDEPDIGDLYNWCPAAEGHRQAPPTHVVVEGDSFEAEWDGLRVVVRIARRVDEPFLRLNGEIHNEREDHRLRLHVGPLRHTDRTIAGAPFELVERPLVGEGSSVETASPTWPARHVVMAVDTAVFHEGVFEYEVVHGGELAVTLLRCVGTISREALSTRPWPAGPNTPTPNAQMIGKTEFVLGVWPAAERDRMLGMWERFALPLADAPARGGGTLSSSGALMPIDGDVELSSVRRRDRHLEATVWNPRQNVSVSAVVADGVVEVGPAKIAVVRVPGM